MAFVPRSKEGEESSEKALIARLRQFVEDSHVSLYKIASSVGTSGGILSMWLSGTARPGPEELDAEKFLKG
jgi:DNA transposition AAA+ family ATPase